MSEPLSRIVRVDAILEEGQTVALEANAAEREALAAFYRLPSIEALSALLELRRAGQGGIRVTGDVHALVTQICVISLEPFQANVNEEIDVRFAPRGLEDQEARAHDTRGFAMADEDEPEPIVEGKIDVGALAAEFFALGLDPYPRKPGATFEFRLDQGENLSPFAALARRGRKSE
ncbi:MAG: DUF177 domain-containing protein [Hyphomicrobiales bacterium]|nr:DUF177 domain-containing protein [Hyphomicrobiales bacterium]